MGNVDVSTLMSDPDFVDPIQVIMRVPRTNYLGEASFSEEVLNTYGSVQPADFQTVNKLPEALRVANVSSFWFLGIIVASAPGKYSSVLVFRGRRYQVQTVADWSHFGDGFTEGSCIAEVPAA